MIMQKRGLVKSLGLTFGAVLMTACASNSDLTEGEDLQALDAAQQEAMQNGMNDVETMGINAQNVAVGQMETAENAAAAAQAALLEMTVFYFDFDNTTIKSESKNALIAHSQYLSANRSARVVLEGHADERGTVEYNLALGERRALSVSRFLQANGASASQIETVSYGEELPQMMGHNNNSWSKNRRVEIKYQSR